MSGWQVRWNWLVRKCPRCLDKTCTGPTGLFRLSITLFVSTCLFMLGLAEHYCSSRHLKVIAIVLLAGLLYTNLFFTVTKVICTILDIKAFILSSFGMSICCSVWWPPFTRETFWPLCICMSFQHISGHLCFAVALDCQLVALPFLAYMQCLPNF